jgi:hypothetical protein
LEDFRISLMKKVKSTFHQSPSTIPWQSYQPSQEGWDETTYFRNKDWPDLFIKDFNTHPYCLSFFHIKAFPFFWGALMFISLQQQIWECRAMENFLIMWEDTDLTGILGPDDPVHKNGQQVSAKLKLVLSSNQVDLIDEYFKFRSRVGANLDKDGSRSFVASLRSSR